MNNRLNVFFPALRIHTWGGFGSQIFTAYLILKLKQQFPGRRILAINHTSGVSRRVTELNFSVLGVRVKQIEDFQQEVIPRKELKGRRKRCNSVIICVRSIIIKTLQVTSLIEESNDETSYNRIRPWTLALRGHYTKLNLEMELVLKLHKLLFNSDGVCALENSPIVLHYRLGDLMNLSQKSPIKPERLDKIVLPFLSSGQSITVLTDSTNEEFKGFVSNSESLKNCNSKSLDPINTLQSCIKAKVFIGTGAKISLWAAIFRYYCDKKLSYLPLEVNWLDKGSFCSIWY